jgi:oxygen-independent coproporphyrinogen-3 oxidase
MSIFDLLVKFGFSNINIDIMYGHPEQSTEMLVDSLEKTLSLKPGTVSLYPLNIKPLTRFWKKIGPQGVDRQKIAGMYEVARAMMIENGYIQDTRLRFILPRVGRYAHKDETIKGKPVKGFGAAAQSYAEFAHYRPPYSVTQCRKDILEYMQDIGEGNHPARFAFFLDDEERMRRAVIMNIRHAEFSREAFRKKFGVYPELQFPSEFEVLYENGLASSDGEMIRLSPAGFRIANSISKIFFSDNVLEMQKNYKYE